MISFWILIKSAMKREIINRNNLNCSNIRFVTYGNLNHPNDRFTYEFKNRYFVICNTNCIVNVKQPRTVYQKSYQKLKFKVSEKKH